MYFLDLVFPVKLKRTKNILLLMSLGSYTSQKKENVKIDPSYIEVSLPHNKFNSAIKRHQL